MSDKIRLSKDKAVVFMGTMNAMPMMYALELRNMGYEVIYFVDASKKNTLSRPENHFPDIVYPYPSWIIEIVLPSQIFLPLFPKLFAVLYQLVIRRITQKTVGCFVLSGFFSSLSPYLFGDSHKIGLPHGSDLDTWACTEHAEVLSEGFDKRSIFKYLPKTLSKALIKNIMHKQFSGYAKSDAVVYFPIGFNAQGDKVTQQLINLGVRFIPRYDISFKPLQGQSREFKQRSEMLEIFSGVRFLFRTFPDGNKGYNKGNDLIIDGIAKYFSINPNIRVHFVEKGEDVQYAKELCRSRGLEGVVVWHQEMPLKDLLNLYQSSDICFDQVGEHWISAIGGYSLWLGKPLIANDAPAVRTKIWPLDNPVCSARTSEEVCNWLVKLEDIDYRKDISDKSKAFAEQYMSPFKTLNMIFDFDDETN